MLKMLQEAERLHVGTSGYSYRHWSGGVFYPPKLNQKEWLTYYGNSFNTVEINSTFYGLPSKEVFRNWYDRTPSDFRFAIKGSRYITHLKKLGVDPESMTLLGDHASGLGEKLDIVLWQLPENLKADTGLLDEFCGLIVTTTGLFKIRHAFEFRNESWFNDGIYDILAGHSFSLCIAHSSIWPCVEQTTADYVYFRFHGGQALYSSRYSDEELACWAGRIRRYLDDGKDVYAYFNNDAYGYAIQNALRLKELVQQ